jgi:hypothetical protein
MLIKLHENMSGDSIIVNETEISHIKPMIHPDTMKVVGARVELHKETLFVRETPDEIYEITEGSRERATSRQLRG